MEASFAKARATADSFDEAMYLEANPDVAAAVSAGHFVSGREHFDRHGEAEGRYQAVAGKAPFTFYETRPPSPLNALDLFAGRWSSKIPGYGFGITHLFWDARIKWFLEKFGDAKGRRILELGPLEGGHTYILAGAGAHVTAIESNSGAYLRCLIIKETFGINANFLLGDFTAFVADTTERFDAVIACGVLYHMENPIEVLANLTRISDTILLWTHYFDDGALRERKLRHKFSENPTVEIYHGIAVELWEQQYLEALEWAGFCGGPSRSSNWLTKNGLYDILQQAGFTITVNMHEHDHSNGPAICLLAVRDGVAPRPSSV